MSLKDIWSMCLQNLTRRKSRTFLTALGVLIGCTSIVVMISIGVGINVSQNKMLEQMGDLRTITVYPNHDPGSSKLDDSALSSIKQLYGVKAAAGQLTVDNYPVTAYASNKRYETTYLNLIGMDLSTIQEFGYEIKDGDFPSQGPSGKNQALAGGYFVYSFKDTARPEGSNVIDPYGGANGYGAVSDDGEQSLPEPYFNPVHAKVTVDMQTDAENQSAGIQNEFEISGVLKENYTDYSSTNGMIVDINTLKDLLKQADSKTGRSSSKFSYSQILVKANDLKDVPSIESSIQQLGFQTTSMESMRQSLEESTNIIQMVLGGIGAISLLVAAIGITNTMIMSITERTREIGIMKALGCYTKNIRQLFLMEAGTIGLIGGSCGIILSYLLSCLLNYFSNQPMESTGFLDTLQILLGMQGSPLSVIPFWLAVFALAFSILIGVISGYYPASRAVKIPALEAIKHE